MWISVGSYGVEKISNLLQTTPDCTAYVEIMETEFCPEEFDEIRWYAVHLLPRRTPSEPGKTCTVIRLGRKA